MKTHLITLIIISSLIAGCGDTNRVKQSATPENPLLTHAIMQASLGNYQEAAQTYQKLALRSEGQARVDYLLLASENALAANWFTIAEAAIQPLDDQFLNSDDDYRRRLIKAYIALDKKLAREVIELLDIVAPPEASIAQQLRQHRLLSQAYQLSGNLLESARELSLVDALETDPEVRLDTQLAIIRSLTPLSGNALTQLQPSPPGVQGGWMSLALIIKKYAETPEELSEQLILWQEAFPEHPVLPNLLDQYFEQLALQSRPANQIAVLLPETGRYAKAANAIRSGIIAAWYQQPAENRPKIHFYDSSSEQQVWPAYNKALDDGAEIIIGPLQKSSVLQLARAGELPVPVLALNSITTDTTNPANLFQFALSPEDEARQVADRAWLDGKRQPLILYPEGDWGNRITEAFNKRWQELDESIAGQQSYNVNTSDFAQPIQALMQLDQSTNRNKRLQTLLGKKLKFEPRIRQDGDFIFLVSRSRQTKEIKPQLQFHYAGELPVYGISHAWTGQLSSQEAPDFSGIMLPDIPWLLMKDDENSLSQNRLRTIFPDSNTQLGRLYAMGIDSYRLLTNLYRLESNGMETLDGETGNLYMDSEHIIHRQLVWVTLGKPIEISGYSPRLDLFNTEGTEEDALFEEEETEKPAG